MASLDPPIDILVQIFTYLDKWQLVELSRVCKKWRIATQQPALHLDWTFSTDSSVDSDAPCDDNTLKMIVDKFPLIQKITIIQVPSAYYYAIINFGNSVRISPKLDSNMWQKIAST